MPNYAAKTVNTSSDKGWSRTTALNNLGLATSNTLSGTGISNTELKPVWRADGSLASVELDIITGPDNQKETHTASFNPDGTLSSLTAPGRGNILGNHSISNGVETLTVNGVTTEASLDGTYESISGANVIGRSEALTTNSGGYKNTTTPAVGAPTDTLFNAALASTGKTYADTSGEAYGYSGERLSSITLARGGEIVLGYSNDGAKDLASATWPAMASGPFTIPSVGISFGYNRSGNISTLSDPSGTRALSYQKGRLVNAIYTAGILKGYEVIPGRDSVGRHNGTLLKRDGNPIHATAKAPNGVSNQITNLASGNLTATPQRDGAGRINGYVWSDGTNSVTQTWARGPGGRIETAGSDVPGAPSYGYLLDPENPAESFDGSGRRLKCTTAGGTWTYVYGAGGQLTSATHPTLGSFTYAFDGIGRRTDKGEANTSDVLNRTTAWTHSQDKTLTVKAHPDARVWFNGVEIENFTGSHSAALTPPGTDGGWVPWETLSILEGAGDGTGNPPANPLANPDAKAEKKGAVWVPPTAETLTYDAAGNRESSAQWNFGWDAKNQLACARTKNHTTAAQGWDITYTYDSEGRRIKKHVIEYLNGTQVSEKIITFVWDGWDLLYERHQLPSGLTLLERKYLWGPDIADGAAGGAGGLLLIRETKGITTTEIIPLYDGGGNVIALADINKNLLASYQFGPFGEKISATGPNANSNPWRWATKYFDEETGLYYFGKRYYDPITGQWLSREILGESESINLYSYCHSDPINNVDVLGLAEHGLIYQFFFGIDPITFEPSSKEKERQQKKQQDDLKFIQFLKEFENGQMDTKEFPLEMKMEFVRQQAEMNKHYQDQIDTAKLLDNGIQIRPAKIELPLASQRSLSLGAPSSGVWESNIDFMLPTGAGAAGAKFLFGGMKSLLPVLATGARAEARLLTTEMRAGVNVSKGLGDVSTTPWLADSRASIVSHIERFREGGSYLVPQSTYEKWINGKTLIGRFDGQFITTRSAMDRVLIDSGGNLAKVKKKLGIPDGLWNEPLVRIDVESPLLLNARLPSGLQSGANEMFRWGGYTSGGLPEIIVNPIPSDLFRAIPTGIKP